MKTGEVVAGRYELEELLGVGGMSSVYRARDRVLERTVALKILHEQFSHDPAYVERFRREARAIAKLSHPNIVTVIDRGEFEGRQFIVFEYVGGETLKQLATREAPLPPERALALVHQVARGLAFAHEHGIVHRDVKPHNVLVDGDGAAKVTDFGIARSLGGPDDGLTQTGTVLGTGAYISPEQAVGRPADERSDQYSLGALLYELLTGRIPYEGESIVAVATRHVRDPVPDVREVRPEISARIDALIRRAMAKRPDDRFPSTDAMIGAIEACLAEEVTRARADENGHPDDGATQVLAVPPPTPLFDPSPPERPRRRRRRRRAPWRLAAVLAVLVLGAALLAYFVRNEQGGGTRDGGGGAGEGGDAVRLVALRDHDPEGGDGEHPEAVSRATDGDLATYWTTETYSSFSKSGVGIVLDARSPVELERLVVRSDEPGFTALIQAGETPNGPFEEVSNEQTVGARTTFEIDTGGEERRFYLIWITDPNGRAHVNEVRGA
ncbi:MAG: protein kinase [Actinobacteria bacterium]|nr:protein kinase [Actinomycetota bacterium]